MEDSIRNQAPVKLDIFTDGSWLKGFAGNECVAGGWGAVIIETYANGSREAWMPSGKCSDQAKCSDDAEMEAVHGALKAFNTKKEHLFPESNANIPLTIHTDQKFWQDHQNALRSNPDFVPTETDYKKLDTETKCKMHDFVKEITAMGATFKFTTHNKPKSPGRTKNTPRPEDDALIDVANRLAQQQSWVQSVERQGGEITVDKKRLKPEEGESNEKFIQRILPLNFNEEEIVSKSPFCR